MAQAFGQLILLVHLLVIAFNIGLLLLTPLGARLGWAWVRLRWLRGLHIASWAVVAVQAALGQACFLTVWQDQLTGGGAEDPLIMRAVNGLIYWDLPLWAFSGLYLAAFAYVLWLWRRVPPTVR